MTSYLWRLWYGLFAWYTVRRGARFRCMNWGYDDPAEPAIDDPERYPLQLYRRVARDLELEGRHLLEVSCGRGGGLAWLHRERRPAGTTGVDYTPGNVRLCRRAFGDDAGLGFEEGRAEALPLNDASVDAVISVEASHCYDDVPGFLDEVARVTRPGGQLAWTDFRPAEELDAVRDAASARFALEEEADITAAVVRALDADGTRRRQLIVAHAPPVGRGLLAAFAGSEEDAVTVRHLRERTWRYFLLRLRR